MAVKVFLTAYQNMEMLLLNLDNLRSACAMPDDGIVIIDMGNDREIKQWLENQKKYSFICAEKLENYARILNTALKQFSREEDILIMNSNFFCLGNCIERLAKVCDSGRKIGAAIPVNLTSICPQEADNIKKLEIAIGLAGKENMSEIYRMIKIPWQCAFLTRRFIDETGWLDEELLLPDSVMLDYSFRGLCQKWKVASVGDAFVYELFPQADIYTEVLGENVDRNVLKVKWGMNYFNDFPNENLIKEIDRQKEEVFTVLEVGCDCGANLAQIHNLFPKAFLFGIEMNASAALVASSFGDVRQGNIEDCNLSYSEQKFDYILFGDVLEHLRDPEKVIRYCRQFLRPGGKIIASIPNLMHYTVLQELIKGNFTYQDMGLLDRTHIHFFTYNEIVRMFLKTGYQINSCTYTMFGQMSEEDKQFVAQLKKMGDCETFFYLAYQYLMVAESDNSMEM